MAVVLFSLVVHTLGGATGSESASRLTASVPCDTAVAFDRIWSIETPTNLVPFGVQPVHGDQWFLLISKTPGMVAGVYPGTQKSRPLFGSPDIHPVGARWMQGVRQEAHQLELVTQSGRVVRVTPDTNERGPVTVYDLAIQPLRAIWAHGYWFVTALDSADDQAHIYRIMQTGSGVEVDTLLRSDIASEDGAGSLSRTDPFVLSRSQDGILASERHWPFRVYHISANANDPVEMNDPLAHDSTRQLLEASGSSARWIGMSTVRLWGHWHVQTLSDTQSDQRILVLYRGSEVIRVRTIDAPMSFVSVLDSGDAEVIAVSNFTKFAVTGYRWRPVCSERPEGHASSLPKGDVR